MQAWILITFGAVTFQTLRFMLQKQLTTGALSAAGGTFARFVYSAPLVLAALPFVLAARDTDLPELGPLFWPYALLGGLTQILATVCMLLLFRSRNFAVGVTFKKTEVVMTALVGFLLLGEGVSAPALLAILVGLAGVLALSRMPGVTGNGLGVLMNRAAGLGLLSGLLFAVCSVSYRAATLAVLTDDSFVRAMVGLAAVTTTQMLGLGLYLALRERGELRRVMVAWRRAGLIGLTSLGGSLCWFNAFTLQNAAYVNAVGQSEVILSLLASYIVFGERLTAREATGIALITASVVGLILVL